jgi:hypothetical protein
MGGSGAADYLRIGFFDHADRLGVLGWELLGQLEDHGDAGSKMLAFLESDAWNVYGSCLGGSGWDGPCDGQLPSPFDEGIFDPHKGFEWIAGAWIQFFWDGEGGFGFPCRKKPFNVVPEPGTAALLGLGLFGLVVAARRF